MFSESLKTTIRPMFLYYGATFILGALFSFLLFWVFIMSLSICLSHKKIENGFIWFWVLITVFIVSYLNYGEIMNISAFFIYFTFFPLVLLIQGIYLLNKYEKK